MKKTLLRKAAMASLFTLMTLTVTKANAKGTFIYGETVKKLQQKKKKTKHLLQNGNTSTSTTNKDD